MRQTGQFADHSIDALPQKPPGVSVRQDDNARIGAEFLSHSSLLF